MTSERMNHDILEIPNPRRILVLSLPTNNGSEHQSRTLALIEDLTGSKPETTSTESNTIAGTTHTWDLQTDYYKTSIPMWIDELAHRVEEAANPEDNSAAGDDGKAEAEQSDELPLAKAIATWQKDFSSPEAAEVVRAVAAWILCFPKLISSFDFTLIESAMKAIADIIETTCGPGWEGTCLAVAMHQSSTPHLAKSTEEWDALCIDHGFEFIDAEAKGRNEYGEVVGVARMKEALEATDWAGDDDGFDGEDDFGDLEGDDLSPGVEGFDGLDDDEEGINAGLWGLRDSLLGGDGDESEERQVESMTRMMGRLQAVKDTSASMPVEERKRFAARAVRDIVKDIG